MQLTDMKCVELLWALNKYVDGTVDLAIRKEFETHLAGYNPCRVVVDNVHHAASLTEKPHG